MTSSPDTALRHRAIRVLQRLLGMLNDQLIAQLIDAPIDRALSTFRFVWDDSFSPADFHRVLGEFLAHVHGEDEARGAKPPRIRVDEAVSLLSQAYQGTYETGYDGAILDVAHLGGFGISGIDAVLVNFAGILKAVGRQQYNEWVYARYLDPFDQPLRREVAACILEFFGYARPVDEDHLAELAEDVPYLLEKLRSDQNAVAPLHADRLAPFEGAAFAYP